VAVGAIAIIVVFMIVLTCIGVVIMESNRYSGNVKYTNDAVAAKARESLAVVQASSTLVNVTNEGSTPVVIIGFYRVNPADNNPNYVPLSNPVTVPLLSSAFITLPQATPENWKVGVVTSLGNVFWEEAPVQGGTAETVPPGEPVYVTFAAQGLGSDALGTVLTVDGSTYTYSQLPKTFQWVSGSTHSFSWSSPVSGSSGVRYVWASTSGLSTKQSDSSFTVNANGYVIATYRTQYILTMNVNPSGGGTTNPAPGTYWYDPGSTVQISAVASSGYVFSSWTGSGSGSYSGTANPASVTVNGPITETANFAPLTATVTFTVSGLSSDSSGTVLTVDGVGYSYSQLPKSFSWNVGSSHTFAWTDPVSSTVSGKRYVWVSTSGLSTAKSGSIIVPSGGGSVSATYKTQYYLTVSSAYDSPTPTSGWFDAGTSVTASVTSPVSGGSGVQYVCTGWSGSGSVPSSGTGTSVTFTINAPSSITWKWKTQYYLTMQANPSYGGTVSPGSGWRDAGTQVQISATPASGYAFTSWTGSGSGSYSGTANPATITMNGPITETANFQQAYTVTFYQYDLPSGASWTVTFAGQTKSSTSYYIYFYNIAPGTYYFSVDYVSYGSGTRYRPSPSSGYLTVSGSTSQRIYFYKQYYLTMQVGSGSGSVSPGSGWYDAGSAVSISASPSSGYAFDYWVGSGSGSYTGSSGSATIYMNAPITETAYFFTFSISISPSSGSVQQGGSVSATVTVTYVSGYTSKSVTLSASNLPSGASYSFSANPVTVSPGSSATSTLTIWTSSSTPAGTYTITVLGSGGGVVKSTTYTLTVTSGVKTVYVMFEAWPTTDYYLRYAGYSVDQPLPYNWWSLGYPYWLCSSYFTRTVTLQLTPGTHYVEFSISCYPPNYAWYARIYVDTGSGWVLVAQGTVGYDPAYHLRAYFTVP